MSPTFLGMYAWFKREHVIIMVSCRGMHFWQSVQKHCVQPLCTRVSVGVRPWWATRILGTAHRVQVRIRDHHGELVLWGARQYG